MKKLKSLLIKLDKKQVIVKKAQKKVKGGMWARFSFRGYGRCRVCFSDDVDH